jgi:hypothetical protein
MTMNKAKHTLYLVVLTATVVLSACTLQPARSDIDAAPDLVSIDSRNAHVAHVSTDAVNAGQLKVAGYLTKRFNARGRIPGELRITAIDRDGAVIGEQVSRYSRRSANSGKAYFSQVLDVRVAEVARVQVEHIGLNVSKD